jgi:hypothetical protein
VDELGGEINVLLHQEKTSAMETVNDLQTRLQSMVEYSELSETQKEELAQPFDRLRRDLGQYTYIAVIRDSLRRFEQDEYSRSLTKVSAWAQEKTNQTDKTDKDPPFQYISRSALPVSFTKAYLADEADVDDYLGQLKAAMLTAIQDGKRIQI